MKQAVHTVRPRRHDSPALRILTRLLAKSMQTLIQTGVFTYKRLGQDPLTHEWKTETTQKAERKMVRSTSWANRGRRWTDH